MQRLVHTLVASLLAASSSVLATQREHSDALATGMHSVEVEARLDRWMHEAMDRIYEGRPSVAARIADAMREAAPDDPRPYLLKARVLRLDVPDQNFERRAIEVDTAAIDTELERAIENANRLLETDPNSLPGLLYRGWALLFQSQMRALTYDYWAAGRKAKSGQKDLERVLELDPGNADARLVHGTYLYFADILPGLVKLAGFIVRIPSGDSDNGIESIEYAATRSGYGEHDAKALLGVVLFGFEGRLEDSIEEFEAVEAAFPDNARILEPMTLADLFLVDRLGKNLARAERAVRINVASPEPWVRKVGARLLLYQAFTELFTGRIDAAVTSLETLLADPPDQPDWLEAIARLALADIQLLLGNHRGALRERDRTTQDVQLRERLNYVVDPDASASVRQSEAVRALQPVARNLYAGKLQEAEQTLTTLDGSDDPCVSFYRGELALLQKRPREALAHFETLTRDALPARYRLFRFFAFQRQAEAHGRLGDDRAAVAALGDAIDFHADRDLMRHVAKARQRYYKNGRPGGS